MPLTRARATRIQAAARQTTDCHLRIIHGHDDPDPDADEFDCDPDHCKCHLRIIHGYDDPDADHDDLDPDHDNYTHICKSKICLVIIAKSAENETCFPKSVIRTV